MCGPDVKLDKELYRRTQISLWWASQAAQGELQAAQNASISSSHYLTLIVGVFDLHPMISPLLIQVSHKEHHHTVWSPGCLETWMVWFCLSHHGQALFPRVFLGKKGLLEYYLSFIFFIDFVIWFCLFFLDRTDRCALNSCWLYCWTLHHEK